MNDLIVWRDKLQELYAMKSIYIDKAVQFVLALVTFLMINQNIGLNDVDVKLATIYQIILLHCQWAGGMQKRTSSSSG